MLILLSPTWHPHTLQRPGSGLVIVVFFLEFILLPDFEYLSLKCEVYEVHRALYDNLQLWFTINFC